MSAQSNEQPQADAPFKTPVARKGIINPYILSADTKRIAACFSEDAADYIIAAINSYAANAKRDAVLKVALEALEAVFNSADMTSAEKYLAYHKADSAIDAIKEALK